MIFSTINFIYLSTVKPLESRLENRIELFNELTILSCAHLYNIFLRGAGPPIFIENTGWVFIGFASFNVIVNLLVVISQSLYNSGENCLNKFKDWRV